MKYLVCVCGCGMRVCMCRCMCLSGAIFHTKIYMNKAYNSNAFE